MCVADEGQMFAVAAKQSEIHDDFHEITSNTLVTEMRCTSIKTDSLT